MTGRSKQAKLPGPSDRYRGLRTHCFLAFVGPGDRESRGVVDIIAIRKDHGRTYPGRKRGDTFQVILIQSKGRHATRDRKATILSPASTFLSDTTQAGTTRTDGAGGAEVDRKAGLT
jgi:hypothetical protein